jgi:DNA-damage-inducible protein D
MSERKINKQHQATFDGIRHVDDAGNEYWLARQLSKVLEYSQYRHFVPVLERAREAGRNSGQRMEDHMEVILTMVDIGSGAQREVDGTMPEDLPAPDTSIQQLETAKKKRISKKQG